jgi:molybdate transport system permease protein
MPTNEVMTMLANLLAEPAWTALGLSLKVACWATLIDLVLGVGFGYLLARKRFPGRELLDAVLTLPMVMPPTVLGYYLLVLIGRHGPLGAWLQQHFGIQLIFTWQAAVIAAAVVAFPLVLKGARAAFEAVDTQLEQAAYVLGLSPWAVFLRVTLPLAWRGVLGGTLLAFARSMGEFGATLMVAGSIAGKTQTLSIAVYEAVQAGQDDTANLLVMITSLVCIIVLVSANRLTPNRNPQV